MRSCIGFNGVGLFNFLLFLHPHKGPRVDRSKMSTVEEFAASLFSTDPKPKGSLNLDIDVNEPSEFFEVLLLIMTCGMKKWYGDRINIADIDLEHVALLQRYFISFGIQIHLDRIDEPTVYMIDNQSYVQETELSKMTFSVAANGGLFTVRFSFAPGMDARF